MTRSIKFTIKGLFISNEDIQLLHKLMKTGYSLKGDADWHYIIERTKEQIWKASKSLTPLSDKEKLEPKYSIKNIRDKTLSDLNTLLLTMIKYRVTDPEIIDAVKSTLLAEAEIEFSNIMSIIFKQLSILSPEKDIELIKKLEPIFCKNLYDMPSPSIIGIIKAFKQWNYISEPFFAKLLKKAIHKPDTLGVNVVVYLMHALDKYDIYNQAFYIRAKSYVNEEITKILEFPEDAAIMEFTPGFLGMYMISSVKHDMLDLNTIKLIGEYMNRYSKLIDNTMALCNIFSAHSRWVRNCMINKGLKNQSNRKKLWKLSDELYSIILSRLYELREKLEVTQIITLMADASLGNIKKKENGFKIIEIAIEGLKKIQESKNSCTDENEKMQYVILQTDLYGAAKCYCNNTIKKEMLKNAIENTELKSMLTPIDESEQLTIIEQA